MSERPTPPTTPSKPVWTAIEDEFLLRFSKTPVPPKVVANRMNASIADTTARLEYLVAKQRYDNPLANPDDKSPVTAGKMDALQLVLVHFCQAYEDLGKQLEFFSTFISQDLTQAQTLAVANEIEEERRTLVDAPYMQQPALYMAEKLHERFIFVPRPLLVPEPEPAANTTTPPTS